MLKQTLVAALSLAAITLSPVPVITGPAFAQCSPNATFCPPSNNPGGGSTYKCTGDLGHLRRVYEEDLDAIEDPLRVAIVPVCTGEDYGVMRSDGNAGALREAIAENEAMMEALFAKNFGSDDVVGIRMTDVDALILYVHEFHHR
jgi:hypothetical protein